MSRRSADAGGAASGALFDAYARQYEDALAHGLRYSGEDSSYFAAGRVSWLRRRLDGLGEAPAAVLDFGCGTGGSIGHLLSEFPGARVTGVDPSSQALDVAAQRLRSDRVELAGVDGLATAAHDVAYCNGVFHHVEPDERSAVVGSVRDSLRPGGLFALWENNPWNPGTRLVMRSIPFDRDAIPLSAPKARRLLRSCGFEVVATDYLFVFPRALAKLRPIEPRLARLPVGAQYMVLARRGV